MAQAVLGLRTMRRPPGMRTPVGGTAAPQQLARTAPAWHLGLQGNVGCHSSPLDGAAGEWERPTSVGTPERFASQGSASTASDMPLTAPPGRWAVGSEAGAAPTVPRAGCWGCPQSPTRCQLDPVPGGLAMPGRRAAAPSDPLSSHAENECPVGHVPRQE
ncbi:unnamed protein product [Prorocentrum cordatum]|uniref:Uncharacterized protein n=1 Tax=Prorocentrum cordatum TaxID=2364126 RepID=A0ABN9R123_9DINO|nr:unnamed protein product [Polarella glacialis]